MTNSNKICLTDDFGRDIDIDELVVLYEQDGRPHKEVQQLYESFQRAAEASHKNDHRPRDEDGIR